MRAGIRVCRHPVTRLSKEMHDAPGTSGRDKRERQYEHIKEGLKERGKGEDTAEEIAARTVNKDRARARRERDREPDLARTTSRPGRRGGLRSHRGEGGRTYDQLYAEAAKTNIKGRSTMNKARARARRRPVKSARAHAPRGPARLQAGAGGR